jgi:hypothetical protein
MTATLLTPYKGYRHITILQQDGYRWLAKLESGLQLSFYEDEFVLDE